jgi:hypothetical protein
MALPGHPHTGLQTVSWLFDGEIEHRDTTGAHALVRPGEINLMTAGSGIAHSEYSTPATTVLHGAQLWVALPERDRLTERHFDNCVLTCYFICYFVMYIYVIHPCRRSPRSPGPRSSCPRVPRWTSPFLPTTSTGCCATSAR